MQLALGAPLRDTVHPHLPFAFTINFEACAVHHNIQALTALFGKFHLHILAAFGQGYVIWHWQVYCPRNSLAAEGGSGKNHLLSAAWLSGGGLARRWF
jgi:hypothetical protein